MRRLLGRLLSFVFGLGKTDADRAQERRDDPDNDGSTG